MLFTIAFVLAGLQIVRMARGWFASSAWRSERASRWSVRMLRGHGRLTAAVLTLTVTVTVTVAMATAPGANAAASWVYIGRNDAGIRYHVDTNSWDYLDDEETQVRFWLKATNVVGVPAVKGRAVRTVVGRQVIDCELDMILYGPQTLYDAKGKVLRSSSRWDTEPEEIVPGTAAEHWRDYVCEEYDAAQEW